MNSPVMQGLNLKAPSFVKNARLIVDTRNAIKTSASHVFKLGAPTGQGPIRD